MAEHKCRRFFLAPWLLPRQLQMWENVKEFASNKDLCDKHTTFVDEVIKITSSPAAESFLQKHLDVDLGDPDMYWRSKEYLSNGPTSKAVEECCSMLPISNQFQRDTWEELIDDWLITFYRKCSVKLFTACQSSV